MNHDGVCEFARVSDCEMRVRASVRASMYVRSAPLRWYFRRAPAAAEIVTNGVYRNSLFPGNFSRAPLERVLPTI